MSFCELGGLLTSLSKGYQPQLLHKQRPTPRASVATGQKTGLSHASLPLAKSHSFPMYQSYDITTCPAKTDQTRHMPQSTPLKSTKAKGKRDVSRAEGTVVYTGESYQIPRSTSQWNKHYPEILTNV